MKSHTRAASTIALVLLATLQPVVAEEGATSDLDAVREQLLRARRFDYPEPGNQKPAFELTGYNFHWEVAPGKEQRVIAVSRMLGSTFMVFRADGSLLSTLEAQELTWLVLCDLDEDGTAEILTEQIEGRGTGVLFKRYHLYGLSTEGLREIWSEVSFSRASPPASPQAVARGLIRCERSGSGIPYARLLYLQETTEGEKITIERMALALREGKLVPVAWE